MDEFKKKNEEEVEKKEEIDIETEEELFKKLEEIISSDENTKKFNIKKSAFPHRLIRTFDNFWLDFGFQLLLTIVVFVALFGWFQFIIVKHFYDLIIISGTFGVVDYLIKALIFKFKPTLYLKTAGLINLSLSIVLFFGIGIMYYFILDFIIESVWSIVGCSLLLLMLRFVISTYIKRQL
mgnify:CR=1 FL=1